MFYTKKEFKVLGPIRHGLRYLRDKKLTTSKCNLNYQFDLSDRAVTLLKIGGEMDAQLSDE